MTEQLITFETAKLAKRKGFDEPTSYMFGAQGEEIGSKCSGDFRHSDWSNSVVRYSRPTQSLLQQYLREVHKINVFVHMDSIFKKDTYMFSVLKFDNVYWNHVSSKNGEFNGFTCYQEALEKGLQKALKLI